MEPWTLIDEGPGSAGYLPVTHRRFELPDRTEVVWDVHGSPASVAVLALTDDRQVVLARQFRPGPMRVLDELPGGHVEEGEDVLDAACRELLEETGYAGVAELAGSTWLSASSRTRRHVAVITGARQVAEPSLDPGELVDVRLIGLDEFRRHLRGGELTDVDLGYLALDHLGLLDGSERDTARR